MKLTKLERRIRKRYTCYEGRRGNYRLLLKVDNQSFSFEIGAEYKKQLDWFRDMISVALARIVIEETKAL